MDDTLHLRLNEELLKQVDALVKRGLFSNKNEAIRAAIRLTLLKYRELEK